MYREFPKFPSPSPPSTQQKEEQCFFFVIFCFTDNEAAVMRITKCCRKNSKMLWWKLQNAVVRSTKFCRENYKMLSWDQQNAVVRTTNCNGENRKMQWWELQNVVVRTPKCSYFRRGSPQCSLNRTLDGPQNRSWHYGEDNKFLTPPGFESQFSVVQPT
jgi:hypothetical protein